MRTFIAFPLLLARCSASILSGPNGSSTCSISTFTYPEVPGASILALNASPENITIIPTTGTTQFLTICKVTLNLTHLGAEDNVVVETWLPLSASDWNTRYLATGGGGFQTGSFDTALGPAVANGYTATSTDGGHDRFASSAAWALKSDGKLDWDLLQNFAYRSMADQVYVGKSITEQYYGSAPRYSYFSGCSTGGRHGYVMAQRYPELVDGILAGAPVLSYVSLYMAEYWPQLVMKEAGTFLSNCEFEYFANKTLEMCDGLDGAEDGVIEHPDECNFDPRDVVGESVNCGGEVVEITQDMAEVVLKIAQGPRTPYGAWAWFGLAPGTDMTPLSNISISPEGVRSLNPFFISTSWFQHLLTKDPSFDVTSMNYTTFNAFWAQASSELGWILDSDTTDLSKLQSSGTKLLSYHGLSDPLIPYQGTVLYRQRVEEELGFAEVNQFYRLFLPAGVDHCSGGPGPQLNNSLAALVSWVEKGEVPDTLYAESSNLEGELVTRNICSWPGKSRYNGDGDVNDLTSWVCQY
ncbi:feruloyl esterase B precursor [Corynespora cassiicola Philippines]|uniref:Carboxylic ester hydrolase n=1 Tax=Corynespora cassiicola Philippines TaxID=1448308 RepID=A0A2T2NIK2_CORCC|nr:feruloyl esterase B precursor [Corynespora cassiicola Philippines]